MGFKDEYSKMILNNAEAVAQVEGLLRTALYLIPGRFRDSELKAELAFTGVSLASLYHDYITAKSLLERGVANTPTGEAIPPLYCLNVAKWVSLVQSVELLVEIFSADKLGERGKWASVLFLECTKVLLRFKILYRTNGNILVHQNVPHRESSASAFQKIDKSFEDVVKSMPPPADGGEKKQLRKTLLDFLNEQKQAKSLKTLLATEPTQNTLMALLPPPPPPNKVTRLCGESLYILRPLVYLAAMYLYGKNSWRAWLLSLGTDLSSYYCLTRRPDRLSKSEKSEIRRRTFLWLYYLVRSPFFESVIQESMITKSVSKLKSVALVKRVLGPLFDYLMVYRQHYFYTSAS